MAEFESLILLQKQKLDTYQQLIDDGNQVEEYGPYSTIETFTARFDGGVEADIKVCNSPDGPFVDPVLFYDDSEVYCHDVEYHLAGSFEFSYDGDTYIVKVEEGL